MPISTSQIASLPNLEPGMSNDSVKILQQWLIESGYSIPDGATGYYGNQTKAAVSAWQQSKGINTQGNPGYFGPISKQYVASQSSSTSTPAQSSSPSSSSSQQTPAQPQQQQQQQQQAAKTISNWNLSAWSVASMGSWGNQPTLTFQYSDGTSEQFRFNNPQDYISKLQQLQTSGASGPLDQFITQFKSALPWFPQAQSQSPTSQPVLPATPAPAPTPTPAPAPTTTSGSTITNKQVSELPTLAPGDQSDSVKTLQQWLIQNGYSIPDGATGFYGNQTKAAVAAWQTKAGFDTQGNPGYFGPLSKTYLGGQQSVPVAPQTTTPPAATTTTPPAQTTTTTPPAQTQTTTPTPAQTTSTPAPAAGSISNAQIAALPTLAPGTTSNDVKTLQQWLIQNGFSIPDGATGYYGDQTKAAVAAWQTKSGIDTQGNPGYFGPISKSYLSGTPAPSTTGTTQTPAQGSTSTGTGASTINNSSVANLPNLAPGMRSDDVKTLQTWLIQNGYSIPDGATGYYGDQTKAAVSSWQQSKGIDTQGNPGYFGPLSKTFISTGQTGTGSTGSSPGDNSKIAGLPNLSPGMRSDDVKALQEWLIQNGYPIPDGATGYYGDQTKAAVAAWQAKMGIDTQGNPGYFGPISKQFLSSNPTAPQSANPQSNQNGLTPELQAFNEAMVNAKPGATNEEIVADYQQRLAAITAAIASTKQQTTAAQTVYEQNKPVNKKFQESEAYKALSPEDRQFVDDAFAYISYGTEEDSKRFADAIKQAKDLAEPYYKSKIAVAQAAVGVKEAVVKNDYNTAKEIIERTQRELLQDVASSKEYLTLEQQADLAREAKGFDYDLLDIADAAAEKGITFATGARSRTEAERRRAETYSDVVQSSSREYNFKVSELENRAARGDAAAQAELGSLNTKKGLALQDIGRGAEEILGTANLKPVEGYTPIGGITGAIEEDKERTTLADIRGGVELQKNLISFG